MAEGQVDRRLLLGALGGAAGIAALSRLSQAGPLSPPAGPIAPTGRTVQEIFDKIARTDVGLAEARIPVQSLPGSVTAQYVISQPGSYYLTGNITGVSGKNGIDVRASGVSIDLNGYSLIGVAGSLSGIASTSGSNSAIEIGNGFIRGWGTHGIALQDNATRVRISRVESSQNGTNGVFAGFSSSIEDCVFMFNGNHGAAVRPGSMMVRCFAAENSQISGGAGLFVFSGGGVVRDCICQNEPVVGIRVEDRGIVENCQLKASGNGIGVNVGGETIVTGCQFLALSQGIGTGGECQVTNNLFARIGNDAISISGGNGGCVEGNSISRCGTGIRLDGSSAGVFVRNNTVRQTAAGYVIPAGNPFGPIVNVAGVGAITAVANADHPWANFVL